MKIMPFLFLIVTFSKCASLASEEKPPFKITKATYTESLKEIRVSINYTSEYDINFLNLFFKGKTTKIIKNNTTSLSGNFSKLKDVDFQLHGDSKKEFGNTVSKKESIKSFDLKNNEAVISYQNNGEVKYYTIKNIEKIE